MNHVQLAYYILFVITLLIGGFSLLMFVATLLSGSVGGAVGLLITMLFPLVFWGGLTYLTKDYDGCVDK